MLSIWDANEYWSSGEGGPWTFFAYPSRLANADGLPPDAQACELLKNLASRGLRVGPWTNAPTGPVAYLACHKEDIKAVSAAIRDLGLQEYCTTRSQELLGMIEDGN